MNCQYGIKGMHGARGQDPCTNLGRYITEEGVFVCGIHDAQAGSTSIRLSDVPKLLTLLGDVASRRLNPGMDNAVGVTILERADLDAMLQLVQKRGVTF